MTTDINLLRIIQGAQKNPRVIERIEHHVTGTLIHLGWSERDADRFLSHALHKDLTPGTDRLDDFEEALSLRMPMPATTNLDACMMARADRTFGMIRKHIPPGSVLDLGGGSGEIAMRIAREGHRVTIADAIDWRRDRCIGFTQAHNNHVRGRRESYNTVIALHVFHHSEDPEKLLAEAFRLARRRVIFIESVTNDMTGYIYGCWVDWFYNRVIHFTRDPAKKIPVPCRFLPATGWEQMVWRRFGLMPTISHDLGIYQYLNPEHHHLFVYDL